MVGILKPLISFSLVFGVTFFAFAQMSYMIFVNSLLEFSTFMNSANTLFSMMLSESCLQYAIYYMLYTMLYTICYIILCYILYNIYYILYNIYYMLYTV